MLCKEISNNRRRYRCTRLKILAVVIHKSSSLLKWIGISVTWRGRGRGRRFDNTSEFWVTRGLAKRESRRLGRFQTFFSLDLEHLVNFHEWRCWNVRRWPPTEPHDLSCLQFPNLLLVFTNCQMFFVGPCKYLGNLKRRPNENWAARNEKPILHRVLARLWLPISMVIEGKFQGKHETSARNTFSCTWKLFVVVVVDRASRWRWWCHRMVDGVGWSSQPPSCATSSWMASFLASVSFSTIFPKLSQCRRREWRWLVRCSLDFILWLVSDKKRAYKYKSFDRPWDNWKTHFVSNVELIFLLNSFCFIPWLISFIFKVSS